eukprot:Ihof_evm16s35 gene=Ihof_evmTU16s35
MSKLRKTGALANNSLKFFIYIIFFSCIFLAKAKANIPLEEVPSDSPESLDSNLQNNIIDVNEHKHEDVKNDWSPTFQRSLVVNDTPEYFPKDESEPNEWSDSVKNGDINYYHEGEPASADVISIPAQEEKEKEDKKPNIIIENNNRTAVEGKEGMKDAEQIRKEKIEAAIVHTHEVKTFKYGLIELLHMKE